MSDQCETRIQRFYFFNDTIQFTVKIEGSRELNGMGGKEWGCLKWFVGPR